MKGKRPIHPLGSPTSDPRLGDPKSDLLRLHIHASGRPKTFSDHCVYGTFFAAISANPEPCAEEPTADAL